jgi:hypothetical protein
LFYLGRLPECMLAGVSLWVEAELLDLTHFIGQVHVLSLSVDDHFGSRSEVHLVEPGNTLSFELRVVDPQQIEFQDVAVVTGAVQNFGAV